MKQTLLVTGAGGYIGQAVVTHALRAGYHVKALLRPGKLPPVALESAEIVYADLVEDPEILTQALVGTDAVIHAAGSFSADPVCMARNTVKASECLAKAMTNEGTRRLVLVGSMAVYDYQASQNIDENALLEPNLGGRDAYCAAKLQQEQALQTFTSLDLRILRVGAVWGPDRLFNAHLGVSSGPAMFRLGSAGEIPTCHIDTCASALVASCAAPDGPMIVNVLDDDRPTRDRYLAAVRACGWPKVVVPLPLAPLRLMARHLPTSLRRVGLLQPATLAARFGATTFSNKRLHERLEGVTMVAFEHAMSQAIANTRGPEA
ncbi:NAD(P)-dependent oxidoreductase [Shimia sp. SDUM112013]|uniref:NAD-dependent epimerase/dehydratase family protein n=1 Tax=Shimia sp. SDUM112013 TaxID=3136160 RepID=UPI0032EF0A3B